jgi:integrase
MAVTERGNSFLVSVTIGGKRYRKTVKDYDEAVKLEAKAKLDLSQGKDPDLGKGKGVTMYDLFKKTVTEAWRERDSKPRRNAELVLDLMGWWELSPVDITPEKLSEAWDKCRALGNSEATINRKKASFSKMFSIAFEFGWLAQKPGGLKQTKERQGRIRIMTPAEETRFLELAHQLEYKRLAALFVFLMDTGARVSEALALRPEDVQDGNVYLDTLKGGQPRLVPLTRRAQAVALKWSGLTQNMVNDQFDRVRGLMGLLGDPQFVPHVCRHTCASRLVMGGMDLRRVKDWLGHKTIATTMRYAHLMPGALSQGVEILEK